MEESLLFGMMVNYMATFSRFGGISNKITFNSDQKSPSRGDHSTESLQKTVSIISLLEQQFILILVIV